MTYAMLARFAELNNEGGEGVGSKELRQLQEDARVAKALAAWDTEWTRERTIARRAAWNEASKAGRFLTCGKFDARKMTSVEFELGFTMGALRTAVGYHKL